MHENREADAAKEAQAQYPHDRPVAGRGQLSDANSGQIRGTLRFDGPSALRSRAKHLRQQADGFELIANMFDAAEKMGTPPDQLEAAYWAMLAR